jgi:hypothetical protein
MWLGMRCGARQLERMERTINATIGSRQGLSRDMTTALATFLYLHFHSCLSNNGINRTDNKHLHFVGAIATCNLKNIDDLTRYPIQPSIAIEMRTWRYIITSSFYSITTGYKVHQSQLYIIICTPRQFIGLVNQQQDMARRLRTNISPI